MATKHKYNIAHQISLLPRDLMIERIARDLEKVGIGQRTFYRDKSILLTDQEEIPGNRLMIYARYFGVEIEQLFNKVPNVKSIHERNGVKIKSPLK